MVRPLSVAAAHFGRQWRLAVVIVERLAFELPKALRPGRLLARPGAHRFFLGADPSAPKRSLTLSWAPFRPHLRKA